MNIQEEIARRNDLFALTTRAEKAVLIAGDVIKMLRMKALDPTPGSYFYTNELSFEDFEQKYGSIENGAREIIFSLLENRENCGCCALGALMISCTLFNNGDTYKEFLSQVGGKACLKNKLDTIFSSQQLTLIEKAFEGWGHAFYVNGYPNPSDRLEAIMQNIIENEGMFVYPFSRHE